MRPLLLALLLLVLATPANAASPEIGIADDRILMPGGPVADRAVAEWRDMGVDTVRIFALWSRIAPARKPSGFRPADPNDPRYQWFYLDNAIERVRAAGMSVTLTVTGPGPAWTSSSPGRGQGQWKPRHSAVVMRCHASLRQPSRLRNSSGRITVLVFLRRCPLGERAPITISETGSLSAIAG